MDQSDSDRLRESKAVLRRQMLEERRRLDPERRAALSRTIAERLYGLDVYRDAGTVHLYIGAVEGEVGTRDIAEESLRRGKRVLCPRVERRPNRIESFEIRSLEELVESTGGLWEPDPARARRVDADEIDLVIVPGIVFDRKGRRIGFGAGFYDRFLAAFQSPKVALAFSLQVIAKVPHAERDVPVDWIVTEAETIDCRSVSESAMRRTCS